MSTLINLDNVSFEYNSGNEQNKVLKKLSFGINKGEIVVILGHNGSGKSTLAKLLNGLLLPTEGDVVVCGYNTKNEEDKFNIRQRVGMVFQNPDNQLVSTIVEEDVAFGPENLGVPPAEIRKRVDWALKTVGMYDYRLHAPHKLSGGQKQRVAIAGVIAMQPECIIFDESTAMLDPQGREEVLTEIKKLNSEEEITIVMITHYMPEATLADRVLIMNDGEIVLDGTPHEVFANAELLKSVNLNVPQSTELALALQKEGINIGEKVINKDEFVNGFLKYLEEKSK